MAPLCRACVPVRTHHCHQRRQLAPSVRREQMPKNGVGPLAIGDCLLHMSLSISMSHIRHAAHRYFTASCQPGASPD
eukprot:3369888-Pleurochrysis_carterae.AAC.1